MKKALIELIAESQGDGSNYTALTGADGSFHIENIIPGRYRMFVERTGYQEVDKHQRPSDGREVERSVRPQQRHPRAPVALAPTTAKP